MGRNNTTLAVSFSSESVEWATPPEVFGPINDEFGFTLDVCASHDNAKCVDYFTLEQDGLSQDWSGVCWMNPPYGRDIVKWVKKADAETHRGVTTVALVPARTDTAWFHDYCAHHEVRFIRGRVYFLRDGERADRPAFPSLLIVFRAATPRGED